jgi:transposase
MPKNSMTASPFVAYVGIDWADKVHAVCELSQDGSRIHALEVDQSPEAIAEWLKQLRAICGRGPIAIGLELSRGGLVAALLQYEGLVLFPVNPKQLSRYRDAMIPSGAKNDPGDAKLLAEFIRDHHSRLRPWIPDDAATRTISLCCELRRKLVDEKKRLIQRLKSLLKTYYPLALDILGDSLTTKLAQDFLIRWPSLVQAQRARPTHVIRFFEEHNCRRREVNERRVSLIRAAVPLTTDPAIVGPSSLMVSVLARQLRELEQAIGEFDGRVAELMAAHPAAHVFRSLPGAGDALAPRLLAAMGSDLTRYDNASQIQSYSGIAPVTKQSGRTRIVQRRRACPHFIKQSFHEFADHARLYSDWSRAYYQLQRARGKRHHAAVRALAYKWIRIIYHLWRTGKTYDEALYVRSLRERRSPVVEFLPSG